MIIGQGLRLALAGVVAGAVATLVLGRSFSSFSQLLYGVRVSNPSILAAVSFAVVIVAVVACCLPGTASCISGAHEGPALGVVA
jgi:hypothetical protein